MSSDMLPELPEEPAVLRAEAAASREEEMLRAPELQAALAAVAEADGDRSDSVIVSGVGLALGLLALFSLFPYVLGPLGVLLGGWAQLRGERFAKPALAVAVVGTCVGVLVQVYLLGESIA